MITLRAPSEVDVVMLTKNSQHMLAKCLASIYQNVPVKNLIIIDGYSTDLTLKILDQFNRKHHNIQIHQLNGSRAKARTEGIRKVTTDWFIFVDSDVILCRDWFRKATADLADGVGAVWGLNVDLLPNVKNGRVLKLQSMVARQCFKLRGGMHDTLILRTAVEGIVIPEELHAYEDAYLVQWIEEHGYRLIVCNSAGDAERERREVDMLLGSRADGLIVASSFTADASDFYRQLAEERVPFVLIDRYFAGFDCPRARLDDRLAAALCTRHLLELGHRRFGFIKGTDLSVTRERFAGFAGALAEAGLAADPRHVAIGGFDWRGGYRAMRELLDAGAPPTAVCCVNDPCAMGAIRACRDAGLNVPRDISIAGAGSIEADYLPEPFLTTTDASRVEIGRQAANLLLDLIAGRSPQPNERLIEPKLVVRRSTAPPSE